MRTMVVPRQVNAGAHDSRAHESRSQSGDNGPRPAAPGQWTPAAQNQDAFFEGMGAKNSWGQCHRQRFAWAVLVIQKMSFYV